MRIIEEFEPEIYESVSTLKKDILKLQQKYLRASKEIRSSCPACACNDYGFAFDKEGFHFVECLNCSSLYVQNPLDKNSFPLYQSELKTSLYSKEVQEELLEASKKRVNSFEFSISRRLNVKQELSIAYYGRYKPLIELLQERFSHLNIEAFDTEKRDHYDLVLFDSILGNFKDPGTALSVVKDSLKDDGYLLLSSRLGSGIDVLLLGSRSNVIPTENLNLFSIEGIQEMLKDHFQVLELSTPGVRDISAILNTDSKELSPFVRYLQKHRGNDIVPDFQEFVQKNLLSSYLMMVAKKTGAQS